MTRVALSARDRATLAVGGGVIAALLLASRGVPAWVRWQRHVHEDAAAATAEAAASQRAVREGPHLAAATHSVEARYFALAPAFVPGEQPAAASAALISLVNGMAQTAGVQLGALQVETDTAATVGVTPVQVRGDGAGDVAGILRFLSALEGGVPLLSVRALSLTPANPGATDDTPETIRVTFVVQGLARYDGDGDQDAGGSAGGGGP